MQSSTTKSLLSLVAEKGIFTHDSKVNWDTSETDQKLQESFLLNSNCKVEEREKKTVLVVAAVINNSKSTSFLSAHRLQKQGIRSCLVKVNWDFSETDQKLKE